MITRMFGALAGAFTCGTGAPSESGVNRAIFPAYGAVARGIDDVMNVSLQLQKLQVLTSLLQRRQLPQLVQHQ
jgi:hypothetical protein